MSTTGMNNDIGHIITNKQELLNSIANYTNAYNNYQGCKSIAVYSGRDCSFNITQDTLNFDNSGNITSGVNDRKSLNYLKTIVSEKISSIKNSISILNTSPVDPTEYDNLIKKRTAIDVELHNLYNIQSSIPGMNMENIDSTIYTGILWTVLATSLVYYIFTKL